MTEGGKTFKVLVCKDYGVLVKELLYNNYSFFIVFVVKKVE